MPDIILHCVMTTEWWLLTLFADVTIDIKTSWQLSSLLKNNSEQKSTRYNTTETWNIKF